MKIRIIHIQLACVFLMLGVRAYSQESQGVRESADWQKAQLDVGVVLMEQKEDFTELLAKVNAARPKTGQEAMFKLNVLLRAGMNKEVVEGVRELHELCPNLDNYQVSSIYFEACDGFGAWGVAQSVVEVFARNISWDVSLDNRLLKHFLESGWTLEKVDQWLASMPADRDNYWIKQRLHFNVERGRGESLVKELTEKVKADPKDINGVIALLDALVYARYVGRGNLDMSWMKDVIMPRRATDAGEIASRLKNLNQWGAAITFYNQAIEIPLADDEVRRLAMNRQVLMPSEMLRAAFAANVREELAECLLKLGRSDEAQKWMVEAADTREKHKLGRNALFAGEVQGASGQRAIENRIREQEKKSENDPEYWRDRALYYRGRNEIFQEEEALIKGLSLTTPQPKADRPLKGHVEWRSSLLADYALFLKRVNRTADAVALLRKEIEQTPAVMESGLRAANLLAFDFQDYIHVDDEVLWNWLAKRPKWEYTEERVLWRMFENAKRDELSQFFSRAEELAREHGPSRAHTLGWIMNRMQFPKRSIPLLKYAVETAEDEDLKERAEFTLFESYLDTGDWKLAEDVFPEARKRLTPREVSEWYGRIAATAATSRAKTDAMRIWRVVANLNPSEVRYVDDLVKAGLRDELTDFYREMQRKMPSSKVPATILKLLEKR